jgi:hypothetical protein
METRLVADETCQRLTHFILDDRDCKAMSYRYIDPTLDGFI